MVGTDGRFPETGLFRAGLLVFPKYGRPFCYHDVAFGGIYDILYMPHIEKNTLSKKPQNHC